MNNVSTPFPESPEDELSYFFFLGGGGGGSKGVLMFMFLVSKIGAMLIKLVLFSKT